MALPPPGSPPSGNPEDENQLLSSLSPTGQPLVSNPTPSITPADVDSILRHFQQSQQEGVQSLFDPFITLENLIGGAVRGALRPEEVDASNPHEGAMKGVIKSLGDNPLQALLTTAPGGSPPQLDKDNFGDPFKVGEALAPKSPAASFAIGLGISFSAPGPDFFKLFKEGKAAEAAISGTRKLLSHEGGELFELSTPVGNYVVRDTSIASQLELRIPTKGVAVVHKTDTIRQLAPHDPDFANAAIASAYRLVGRKGTDPASLLQQGYPVPIGLLTQSKYAESLRSPLKSMAQHPKTADNLLQLVNDPTSKTGLKWLIYEPDDPSKAVTFVLPKPFDHVEFPSLDDINKDFTLPLEVASVGPSRIVEALKELLPTGVERASFLDGLSAPVVNTSTVFNVTVKHNNLTFPGRAIPVVSGKSGIAGAALMQLVRRATGELPPAPVKTFTVPSGRPMFNFPTIFDPEPLFGLIPNNKVAKTAEELQSIVASLPPEMKVQAGRDLSRIVAADLILGRSHGPFKLGSEWIVDELTGTLTRRLSTEEFSKSLGALNPQQASDVFEFVDPTGGLKKVAEILGIDDINVEEAVELAVRNLRNDTVFQALRTGDNVIKNIVSLPRFNTYANTVLENIDLSPTLMGFVGDVAIPEKPAKMLPRVSVIVKVKPPLLTGTAPGRKLLEEQSGRFTIHEWKFKGFDFDVLRPTETFPDLASHLFGDKVGKAMRAELEAKVAKGVLSPAFLMKPVDLAPQLINGAGAFNPLVDVPNAAQAFKVFVEERLPEVLRDRGQLAAVFDLGHPDDFPKQLLEVAEYYRKMSKESPEDFARMSGIVATLQKGETQAQLSRYLRNTGQLEALRRSGVEIVRTPFTKFVSEHDAEVAKVEAAGGVFEDWSPQAVANMFVDPAKVDEMFDRYAHELPPLVVRRIADGDLFQQMARVQVPGLPEGEEFTSEWIGTVIKDFGYPATAFNPVWGLNRWPQGNMQLEIHVPEGIKGLVPGLLSHGYAVETEVILPRNLPMRIIDVGESHDGIPKLVMEALPFVGAGVVVAEVGASFLERDPQDAFVGKPPLEEQ